MTPAGRPGPESFLFLVGCGRSGTTLLTAMLDSHPDLAIPGESGGFILRFCDRDGGAGAGHPALLEELQQEHRFRKWGLDAGAVLEQARARQVSSRPDFIRAVYGAYAEAHGKTRFGDKTPDYVMNLPKMAALFPEARFVHLIRDGRDVALAMRDTSWGPKTMADAGRHWTERVQQGRADGRRLGPGRYAEARYEDLVSNPEVVLKELCGFLDLPFADSMLDYRDAAHRQLDMSPAPAEDASLRKPVTAGLRDWRTQMTVEEIDDFEAAAAPTLAELGYLA